MYRSINHFLHRSHQIKPGDLLSDLTAAERRVYQQNHLVIEQPEQDLEPQKKVARKKPTAKVAE